MADEGSSQEKAEQGTVSSPPPQEPPPAGTALHRRRPGAPKPVRPSHRIISWLAIVLLAVVVAVVLRSFVVQTFFVPSGSMIPTLQRGDRILVQKLGYSINEGAIVVFHTPPQYRASDCGGTPETDLVKRVIGLPGETIMSVGNTVYINGKPLSEPYLPRGQSLGAPINEEKIPPGEYFMMGDNRPVSCDSRVWGLVPRRDIIGRVFLVIWRHGRPAFHWF